MTTLVTDALTVAFLLSAGVAGAAPPGNSAAEKPSSVLHPLLFREGTHSTKMVNKCRVTENKLYEQSGSLKIQSQQLCGEHGCRCNSSKIFVISTETHPSTYMANILFSSKFYNIY